MHLRSLLLPTLLLPACRQPLPAEDTASPAPRVDILALDDAGPMTGWVVDSAGDVDGDGLGDLLVGHIANLETIPEAWLLQGGSELPLASTRFTGDLQTFGATLAGIGDTDGDGFDDFAIGTWEDATVQVYRGAADGPVLGPLLREDGSSLLGYDLAGAGDFNGDGFADLAILDGRGQDGDHTVLVCPGSSASIQGQCERAFSGPNLAGFSTHAVATIGDLTGDWRDELGLVTRDGALYVVSQSAEEDVVATRLPWGAAVPWRAAAGGDLDEDGRAELLVIGVDEEDLVLGRAEGMEEPSDMLIVEIARWEGAGVDLLEAHLMLAGDVDGDGRSEIAVSACGLSTDQGWVDVLDADGTRVFQVDDTPPYKDDESARYYAGLGISLAAPGDVDGDGRDDLVVGGMSGTVWLIRYPEASRPD